MNTRNTSVVRDEAIVDDNIQHGIDDNPNNDPEKGATLGGVGGAAVGLAAGAAAGPIGAVAGAIIGGAAGALMSGAAVAAVDAVDNDNNVSGIGDHMHREDDNGPRYNFETVPTDPAVRSTPAYNDLNPMGAGAPVVQTDNEITGYNQLPGEKQPSLKTGGHAVDGTPDTRSIGEKVVDTVTGDTIDDKTGKRVR